ncbi:hypothetical protein B0T11DRAFT_6668 [Plectosphaerella cucumerina]|uniref:Secreted protein n=1 Tax=Plectosphaerella cucumerina TaxID=40658 RepID=A0A8K0TNL6_9PEZI|nr:hypothetical protein B0T11DRAFT_6668 [Plectosphaerella cucumerina]
MIWWGRPVLLVLLRHRIVTRRIGESCTHMEEGKGAADVSSPAPRRDRCDEIPHSAPCGTTVRMANINPLVARLEKAPPWKRDRTAGRSANGRRESRLQRGSVGGRMSSAARPSHHTALPRCAWHASRRVTTGGCRNHGDLPTRIFRGEQGHG